MCIRDSFHTLLDGFKDFGTFLDGCACADGQAGAHLGNGAIAAHSCTCTDHNILRQAAALDNSTSLDHNAVHQDCEMCIRDRFKSILNH